MSVKVTVIGLWHQGIVGSACLADWGNDVIAADTDAAKIAKLKEGKAPLFEPGLDELLAKGRVSGKLNFTTNAADAVHGSPYVLLMHDTPVDENDRGDLSIVFRSIDQIAPALADGVSIHVTAQVPVGTCDEIIGRIRTARPNLKFAVAYSPENLRLGQAIERFRKPPLPILGSDDAGIFQSLETLYLPCGIAWHRCNLRTAEMSKHALNAFLALSVTFANELGNLCDEVGADGHRLAELLRMEPRIGPKAMLFPGLGFSGGTLARDMQTLRGLGDKFGVETPLLDGTWNSNQQQNRLVVHRLTAVFGGSLRGRQICVLGLTYKPDTSTLRRSAALEVIGDLTRAGAIVTASDPKADRKELLSQSHFVFHEDPLRAVANSDALVLMTPWANYRALDFAAVKSAMRGDLVFDASNLWKADAVISAGLRYLDIGSGRAAKKVKS
jgi:UDPglucose 6-dehydrogenase